MTERAFKLTLILLALVGLLLVFQGRSWAGIYVAYDSNPMMVLDGANCSGGVTEAIKQNPGARIIFESTGGGSAESTIGAWSGAASGVSEVLSNYDFQSGITSWTASGGVTLESTAGGQVGNCLTLTTTAAGWAYTGVTGARAGSLILYGGYRKSGTAGNIATRIAIFRADFGVVRDQLLYNSSGAWVRSANYTNMVAATDVLLLQNSSAGPTVGTTLFDEVFCKILTSPGPNGCLLGPVTVRGGFNPNAITKFKILRPVSPREQRRHRTGPWRVVWDSSVN